jgi:DNA repair protein RadC
VTTIQLAPCEDSTATAGEESPRARLMRLGAQGLEDASLVALLLGVGASQARALLSAHGGLKGLCTQDALALASRAGVGAKKAATLLAAVELGRRSLKATDTRPRLRTPAEIYAYLSPTLSGLRREVFHVLCFNPRNVLLSDARVAEGTINSCPVDPREVFAAALNARASAIVLAHNHPSGDPEPSAQDVALTSQLSEGARLLGIKILDHVVVGDGSYASLLERGQMLSGSASAWT